jgi:hypothetical protein
LLRGDCALFFPVAFIPDEDFVDAFAGVLLDVGEPCANIWLWVSGGVYGEGERGGGLSKLRWSVTS